MDNCACPLLGIGKDVKKLRTDAAAACPSLSEAAIDGLVPPKSSVALQKLANRATVYSLADGGPPLFFEVPLIYLPLRFATCHNIESNPANARAVD